MLTVCDLELYFITHFTSVTVKQDATGKKKGGKEGLIALFCQFITY